MTPTILVVDDESLIRWSLKERLKAAGYKVLEAENGAQAFEQASEGVDLVLLDYRLPDLDGVTILKRLKEVDPDILVILMTAYSSIETAIEAVKLGAYHYVNKPFNLEDLLLLVQKALETTQLKREVKALRASRSEPYAFDCILGASPSMEAAKSLLRKVTATPSSTVLLTGESGTGKDLAAKVIHFNSSRAAGPFMNITCSALQETLLESELFGHERGAFTDARQLKKGLFELADGGSVFLDEIGETAASMQVKLLRVLEEKSFKRVGGTSDIRVDVRVIAATNRNLKEAVQQGRFREDLFYRLQVLAIHMPPLRERTGDIPLLAKAYVDTFNREFRKSVNGISKAAMDVLERYTWPGNVRELRNAIERAMLLAEHDTLLPEDFALLSQGHVSDGFRLPPSGVNFEQLERQLVEQALERAGGNQTRAAALLGMNRDQIRYRIEKFGLGRPATGADTDGSAAT